MLNEANILTGLSLFFLLFKVSNQLDYKKGEWVHLVVQNKRGGEIISICDNKKILDDLAAANTPEVWLNLGS